jgi:hypothetical protein
LKGNDNNINVVSNIIGGYDSIEDITKAAVLIALFIIKYQTDKEEPNYKRYYRALYRLRLESTSHQNVNDDIMLWFKSQLHNTLNAASSPFYNALMPTQYSYGID